MTPTATKTGQGVEGGTDELRAYIDQSFLSMKYTKFPAAKSVLPLKAIVTGGTPPYQYIWTATADTGTPYKDLKASLPTKATTGWTGAYSSETVPSVARAVLTVVDKKGARANASVPVKWTR